MFYLFFANGTEETEAVAVYDVLKRADIDVKTVGVGSKTVVCSHGLSVNCDISEDEITLDDKLQGVILPGGIPGTPNLEKSENVKNALEYCSENSLYMCAICAAPSVLGHLGYLKGKKAVCFPGFESELNCASVPAAFTCTDGNIITGRGMGCAVAFGLAIAAAVKGENCAAQIKNNIQAYI